MSQPQATARGVREEGGQEICLAVLGAHLSGEPLNHQLTDLGARFLERSKTAPRYRFYALSTAPPKPGLIRSEEGEPGASIDVELWRLSAAAFGRFVDAIPSPLCIGRIELCDGKRVAGFLCEPYATRGARDITHLGGWKAFLRQRAARGRSKDQAWK